MSTNVLILEDDKAQNHFIFKKTFTLYISFPASTSYKPSYFSMTFCNYSAPSVKI